MPDLSGSLIVGAILTFLGLLAIARGRFSVDLGRQGTFRPKPIFTVTLTKARALLFGAVSLIAGLILLGMSLYIRLLNVHLNQGVVTLITLFAAALTVLIYVIELLIEFLVEYANKRSD